MDVNYNTGTVYVGSIYDNYTLIINDGPFLEKEVNTISFTLNTPEFFTE